MSDQMSNELGAEADANLEEPGSGGLVSYDITEGEKPQATYEPRSGIDVYSYEELQEKLRAFASKAPQILRKNEHIKVRELVKKKIKDVDKQGKEIEKEVLEEVEHEVEREIDPTLEELEAQIQDDAIALFIVSGDPGTGKTRHMKAAVPKDCLYIEGGKASAYGLHCDLYPHRYDPIVVIDDADSIFLDADGRNLAKGICQTDRVKRVSWRTMAKDLKERGVPRFYNTCVSVGIVTNDDRLLSHRTMGPLLSRGMRINFKPAKYEIHRQTRKWFVEAAPPNYREISEKIYKYIEKHLDQIRRLDMRVYYNARAEGVNGADWTVAIRQQLLGWDSREILVEKLMKETATYPTIEEAIRVFHRLTGQSKRTFDNIATNRGFRKYRQPGSRPVEEVNPIEEPVAQEEQTTPIQELAAPSEPEVQLETPEPVGGGQEPVQIPETVTGSSPQEKSTDEAARLARITDRDPSALADDEIDDEIRALNHRDPDTSPSPEEAARAETLAAEHLRRAEAGEASEETSLEGSSPEEHSTEPRSRSRLKSKSRDLDLEIEDEDSGEADDPIVRDLEVRQVPDTDRPRKRRGLKPAKLGSR